MKNLIVLTVIAFCASITIQAQGTDAIKITETITSFATAGDTNNATELAKLLDDNYRIISNRLFGSDEVTTLTKNEYLEKIRSGEYGGDQRELIFETITINGTTASAKVNFKGVKMNFASIIILVKDQNGNWKLVSETPVIV